MRQMLAGTLVVLFGLVAMPLPGGAAEMSMSIKSELKTAAYHSGELAQRPGVAIGVVKLHLQHTLNCLEGPKGMHFVQAAGYPCQGQGNGIVPDLKAAAAKGTPGAKEALQDAQIAWTLTTQALTMTNPDEAQPWAKVISRYIQMASDSLG